MLSIVRSYELLTSLFSTYYLYRATGDDRYLDALEMIMRSLELTRTACGFACVVDVTAATVQLGT